jgi:hypothetical protein
MQVMETYSENKSQSDLLFSLPLAMKKMRSKGLLFVRFIVYFCIVFILGFKTAYNST